MVEEDLEEKIVKALKKLKSEELDIDDLRLKESPLSPEIMEETIPHSMKLPILPIFNGEGDPRDHTSRFTATMGLLSVSDAILCRVFPTTLTGTAQRWYNKLKPGSIKSFASLSTEFLNRYLTNIPAKTTTSILRACIQEEGETLRRYIERFNKQAMKIDNLNVDMATEALREGTRFGKLVDKLLVNK